jgi:hypothetical protein
MIKYASIADFGKMAGFCPATVYNMIADGIFKTHKIGTKKTLVDVEHGLAWIAAQPAAPINGRVVRPLRRAA